jgi:FdhD protein
MGRVTRRVRTERLDATGPGAVARITRPDTVVVEEPLAIRVGGEVLTVTMRTPGDDFSLALGLLVSEGVISGADDVVAMMHCVDEDDAGSPTYNVVDVTLRAGVAAPPVTALRTLVATSGCGLCGAASIEATRHRSAYDVSADLATWRAGDIVDWPGRLRREQAVFDRTGGVHAAGLVTPGGDLAVVREDVGRHNAVDKVVGTALREGRPLPLTGHALVVSARASFELVQKAYLAGIPLLAAVSAPSSLAVDLATEVGMTLVGFVRAPRMVVYAGQHRVTD